jgi:hypothetical protein
MNSLKAGNCDSTLHNTIIGSLVGRNCILISQLTVGSSLITTEYQFPNSLNNVSKIQMSKLWRKNKLIHLE